MLNTSQVIVRNIEYFEHFENGIIVGLPNDDLLSEVNPRQAFTWDYSHFSALNDRYENKLIYDAQLPANQIYDKALIFLPKSKEEFRLLLLMVTARLRPGADLFLVGSKQEGIVSAAKELLNFGDNPVKVDSARHCQLWKIALKEERYQFNLDDWISIYNLSVAGLAYRVCSLPGVFSFGRLDEGTRLLLESIDRVPSGRLLDFGAGTGVLGTFLKLKNPDCSLEMVDIHALSLYCCRRTLELNGLEAKVYPSSGWEGIEKKFHGVFTNPPFHSGVKTHYATTENFISQLPTYLVSGGKLWLVANQFLKYGSLIDNALGGGGIYRENSRFKVYRSFKRT